MSTAGARILVIGGSYRALCVLERLLERGERVVAFVGQEGGGERDFCSEILEVCDRASIAARSARKFGEEMVRWLEDRIRPDLAIAVGVTTEIPLAIGGNCRSGLLEIVERTDAAGRVVQLRQRGQSVIERRVDPASARDADLEYAAALDATLGALDFYLDRLRWASPERATEVPFEPEAPLEALESVVARGEPGEETAALEAEVARYLEATHVFAVSSASAAFATLARALALGAGDEVLVPALISGAALDGIEASGARPVFVEVRENRMTLDPLRAAAAITPRTRALVVGHSFGQPAELTALYGLAEKHGLELLEDGGGALGARYAASRLGRAPASAVFELGGCAPAAVALVTLSEGLARAAGPALRALRVGDGAAGLGRRELAALDDRISARRAHASFYSAELSRYDAFRVPATPDAALPVYARYLLRLTRYARTSAEDLVKLLAEAGIEARRVRVHCPERDLATMPAAEGVRSAGLLLPVSHALARPQLERVLDAIFDYAVG